MRWRKVNFLWKYDRRVWADNVTSNSSTFNRHAGQQNKSFLIISIFESFLWFSQRYCSYNPNKWLNKAFHHQYSMNQQKYKIMWQIKNSTGRLNHESLMKLNNFWFKKITFSLCRNFNFIPDIPLIQSKIESKQNKKSIKKKNIIPKLCNTKYKAFKLRNPSVMVGSGVDSIYRCLVCLLLLRW
jgi:hypothetical protein